MKKLKIAGICTVSGILGILIAGQFIYSGRFIGNSTLNNIDVQGLTAKEAIVCVEYTLSNTVFNITDIKNNTFKIDGKDIGLEVSIDNLALDTLVEKSNNFWISKLIQGLDFNAHYTVSYGQEKLKAELEKANLFSGTTESKDAYIDDNLNIIPETQGDIADYDAVMTKMDLWIKDLNTNIDLSDAGCYKKPTVTKEMLETKLDNFLNEMDFSITYKVPNSNDKEYVFNLDYMKEYIEVDESGEIKLSEEASESFVNMLNRELTTFGNSLQFKTTSGDTITVPGGNWGWWLNRAKTLENLNNLISEKKDAEGELFWIQQAPYFGDSEFINYVEIDLGNQHLYLYKEGKLIGDWDIVSGTTTNPDRKTPAGVYKLTYKERNATLNGPGYSTPVSYWMPFNGDIGIHDAGWRGSFGGTICKYNGSHGCINMPVNGAKTVYENIDSSYAIICYY